MGENGDQSTRGEYMVEATYDVIVAGAGNAALCAALSAREGASRVVVLEKAPPSAQGGNCPYTGGGFRFFHNGIQDIRSLLPDLTDEQASHIEMSPYTADDFRQHLLEVSKGETDSDLMEVIIGQSRPTVEWMHAKGVTWELPGRADVMSRAPTRIPSRVALSAWNSGVGLIQMLTTATRRQGIDVLYETKMLRLIVNSQGRVSGVVAQDKDGVHDIHSHSVVLACGGFEANREMRVKYLGGGWQKAKVRGAKYNTGDGHRVALEIGAQAMGQMTGCHATPIDINAPDTGNLELTSNMPRRSYPLGIMVNVRGERFTDEGENFAEHTFVPMARAILEQPRGIAFQIFDSKAHPYIEPRYSFASQVQADTIEDLAQKLGINPEALVTTTAEYNNAAHKDGDYNLRELDGRATRGLKPPKSNWAFTIDSPPYEAYTVTGGITYTYGGLKINTKAQVLNTEDIPIAGLYAAGEIVGGIFLYDSLRAAGLMHGAVFGRIAGTNAASSL